MHLLVSFHDLSDIFYTKEIEAILSSVIVLGDETPGSEIFLTVMLLLFCITLCIHNIFGNFSDSAYQGLLSLYFFMAYLDQ